MDWSVLLAGVGPTTACIGLLMVGLGLVWTYVYFGGGQPDVSVKEPPQATGAKKGGKGKAMKAKQVEDSPKPVRQPRASKKQTQKEGGVSPADPAPAPRKSGGKRSKKSKVNVATQEDTAQPVEEDNEGEWQTQLSRQKLRALRKQQQEQEQGEGKRDSPEGRDSQGGGGAGQPEPEKGHTPSPVLMEGQGSAGKTGGISPELLASSDITDMETALKDAARSSASSTDEGGADSSTSQQEEGKRKTAAEGSQSSGSPEQEEWVVL